MGFGITPKYDFAKQTRDQLVVKPIQNHGFWMIARVARHWLALPSSGPEAPGRGPSVMAIGAIDEQPLLGLSHAAGLKPGEFDYACVLRFALHWWGWVLMLTCDSPSWLRTKKRKNKARRPRGTARWWMIWCGLIALLIFSGPCHLQTPRCRSQPHNHDVLDLLRAQNIRAKSSAL